MPPNGKKENLLSSWKEIAAYLDRDVRTCVRWEKKYGLPVHRLDKDARAKVFADRDEIDRWLAQRSAQEALGSDEPAGWNRSPWVISAIYAAAVLAVAVLAYVLFHRAGPSGAAGQPYGFRLEGPVLTATDRGGRALWTWKAPVGDLMTEEYYRDHFQDKIPGSDYVPLWPYLAYNDVNGDGLVETLFAVKTRSETNEGVLFCLDHKGHDLWRFDAGRKMDFGGQPFRSEYRIYGFNVADYDEDGKLEILVLSFQKPDWPCQVALLDGGGNFKGEYWNSGYLMDAQSEDIDGDGRKETLLSGVNKEYRKGCIVIFKGGRIAGGSPQDSAAFRSASLTPGTEIAYILVPNAYWVRSQRQQGDAVNTIWARKGEGLTAVAHDSVIYFDFNARLECVKVTLSDATRNIYAALAAAGKVSRPLGEAYARELEAGILYRHQGAWGPQPPIPPSPYERKGR